MGYLNSVKFNYFPANINNCNSLGEVSLGQYLKSIKLPKEDIVKSFKKIEEASLKGDKETKDKLKSKLYYFTPCVTLDGKGRGYENITGFTGIMIVDLDNLTPEFAKEIKEYLFETYPFVIASFLSASKKGVKLLIRIPKVNSTEEFKALFYGLMSEWQYYKGIDFTSKNAVLPNFLTYDKELLYRLNATEWTRKGIQLNAFPLQGKEVEPLEDVSEEDVEDIKLRLFKLFDKIVDNGHYAVRSASLLAGGWVGYGYMEYDDMLEYLFELIENTPYLQSKIKTYKRTCVEMLNKGMTSPIELN